ncbi:uncharacterized protein ANIA_11282 [Aspergillus nidulans FGSC A4]|uniref:Uncharacterized protein n=1 Tax=Emericella nidulans (strain FGSC A4 / ATCC 38163 / CBS 112.46 / NRRL 194 / M139) TaxID=227321 RepID=C8VQU1_EMENI|nr:hypothetical protein [Aspergillus nidulans FGSC A4]CBF88780.1 TPA: hypothetical protein ANIA_11282 [Aspergillus nidulans FGSC A4]
MAGGAGLHAYIFGSDRLLSIDAALTRGLTYGVAYHLSPYPVTEPDDQWSPTSSFVMPRGIKLCVPEA